MKAEEKLEEVCFNCNNFFPSTIDDFTDLGICLADPDFEPFIDELIEDYNYDCCRGLVEAKKFPGEQEACSEFSEIECNPALPHLINLKW